MRTAESWHQALVSLDAVAKVKTPRKINSYFTITGVVVYYEPLIAGTKAHFMALDFGRTFVEQVARVELRDWKKESKVALVVGLKDWTMESMIVEDSGVKLEFAEAGFELEDWSLESLAEKDLTAIELKGWN